MTLEYICPFIPANQSEGLNLKNLEVVCVCLIKVPGFRLIDPETKEMCDIVLIRKRRNETKIISPSFRERHNN